LVDEINQRDQMSVPVELASGVVVQRRVRYLIVYVDEAHAADRWRMEQPKDIRQPLTLKDRADICNMMSNELGLVAPTFLDAISQPCGRPEHYGRCGSANFERLYAAWPLRRMIVDRDGTILHRGDIDSCAFEISDQDDLLAIILSELFK
jgi:hypothetical protein